MNFKNDNINKNIGVTFSCWDLLHTGHNIFLEDSKKQCNILCVGLQTDPTIDRPSKNKPIQSLEEREIQIKSCQYVDYYFIYSTEESLYDSLKKLSPNVRFLLSLILRDATDPLINIITLAAFSRIPLTILAKASLLLSCGTLYLSLLISILLLRVREDYNTLNRDAVHNKF